MKLLAGVFACAWLLFAQKTQLDKAWDLVAHNQRPQAIELLRKLVREQPRSADARLLLGSLLQEAGERDECLQRLNEAVKLRPRSAEAQNALGEAYQTFGVPQSARGPLERAIAINPRFATARLNLGLALLQLNALKEAAIQLDRAIALFGPTADAGYAYYLRAKIYTQLGDVQAARIALSKSLKLQPDSAEAWSDLGMAIQVLGDDSGASRAFERAVELSPKDAVAQMRLGASLLAAGEAHLAAIHFEEAVRLNPGDQTALNGWQRALREDGDSAGADAVKGKLAEVLRARDKAYQDALLAIRLNNEGTELEKTGNLRAAVEKYARAHELDTTHSGIQVNYAVALLRLGEWKEGLEQLRDAARREPNDSKIRAALEDALRQAPVEFGGKAQGRSRR